MVKHVFEMAVGRRAGVHHAHLRRSAIEGRQLNGCRAFVPTAIKLAGLSKAFEALLSK